MTIRADLDNAVTPGVNGNPADGPYPGTVAEAATEIVGYVTELGGTYPTLPVETYVQLGKWLAETGAAVVPRWQYETWLTLIAEGSCETFTGGPGSCTRPASGRWAIARYGADRWCDPCRAWAALNGVEMTTQPAELEVR